MVSATAILVAVGYGSIVLNLFFLGTVMFIGDIKSGWKLFFDKRFKLRRQNAIYATILGENRSSHSAFYKTKDGTFKIGKSGVYTVDNKRIVMREDGYPSGVWAQGNGSQLDFFKVAAGEKTNANLVDNAIKMALTSAGNAKWELLFKIMLLTLVVAAIGLIVSAITVSMVYTSTGGSFATGGVAAVTA